MYRNILLSMVALFCAVRLAVADEIHLPRATPESQGVSSQAIREFIETANLKIDTLHSFMLVRHGHVIAEGWWKPESADKPHVLHSLSNSFCSTAVGLAVSEGKVITADTKDMQAELNVVWDKLLPAFQKSALPANPAEESKLKATLAELKVHEKHINNTLKPPGMR